MGYSPGEFATEDGQKFHWELSGASAILWDEGETRVVLALDFPNAKLAVEQLVMLFEPASPQVMDMLNSIIGPDCYNEQLSATASMLGLTAKSGCVEVDPKCLESMGIAQNDKGHLIVGADHPPKRIDKLPRF